MANRVFAFRFIPWLGCVCETPRKKERKFLFKKDKNQKTSCRAGEARWSEEPFCVQQPCQLATTALFSSITSKNTSRCVSTSRTSKTRKETGKEQQRKMRWQGYYTVSKSPLDPQFVYCSPVSCVVGFLQFSLQASSLFTCTQRTPCLFESRVFFAIWFVFLSVC